MIWLLFVNQSLGTVPTSVRTSRVCFVSVFVWRNCGTVELCLPGGSPSHSGHFSTLGLQFGVTLVLGPAESGLGKTKSQQILQPLKVLLIYFQISHSALIGWESRSV